MTNTCTCLPGDCHGGHIIQIGPAARFHEIPQTVSAIRWTGDNADAIKTWVGHTSQGEPRFLLPDEVTGQWESPGLFNDSALEWESVYPGDWIVQRPDGVFTRCDHEVFTATTRPETNTITAGPAWVCVADERLRQLRDDPDVCTNPGERSMAAELLAARARITELEAAAQADERAIEEARDERDAARDRAAELEAAAGRRADRVRRGFNRRSRRLPVSRVRSAAPERSDGERRTDHGACGITVDAVARGRAAGGDRPWVTR